MAVARAIEHGFALDEAAWLAMARAARSLAVGSISAATFVRPWLDAYAALLAAERGR